MTVTYPFNSQKLLKGLFGQHPQELRRQVLCSEEEWPNRIFLSYHCWCLSPQTNTDWKCSKSQTINQEGREKQDVISRQSWDRKWVDTAVQGVAHDNFLCSICNISNCGLLIHGEQPWMDTPWLFSMVKSGPDIREWLFLPQHLLKVLGNNCTPPRWSPLSTQGCRGTDLVRLGKL